jgi:hypothetical protein
VSSGADAFQAAVNGSRIHFGAGASDYASSDGTTVTFAGAVTLAAGVTSNGTFNQASATLQLSNASGSLYFSNAAATSGVITANISAANASTTVPAFKFHNQTALDATDLLVGVQTGAAGVGGNVFSVDYSGLTTATVGAQKMGTGAGVATCVSKATATTTAVGNVDAGTDDLISYSLPADSLVVTGKGVRITAWGTTANNVNAKTVTLEFGGQTIMTQALTTSIAGTWRISAMAFRTGASTQDIFAELLQLATIIHKHTLTAGTQTETGAIVIKCTGTATTTNDIVQEGLLVEYL